MWARGSPAWRSLELSALAGGSAFGAVSGAHFNPAVTVGLAIAQSFPWAKVPGYVCAQITGGATASSLLVFVLSGAPDELFRESRADGFASTGRGPMSP